MCLCAALLCAVFGVAAVSHSRPSAGISKPSFELSLQGGVYSLNARDAALNEILEHLAAVSGARFQIDPNLDEKVTVDLKGATLEEVLAALTKSQAMIYERDGDGFKLVQASITSQQDEIAPAMAEPVAERTAEEEADLNARGVLTNSKKATRDLLRRDSKSILLQNAMIDTEAAAASGKSVDVPADFRASENTEYYIVQFDHPVSDSEQAALAGAGATVSHYVPNYAYAVHAKPSQLAAIKALSGVIFVEPYHPYYKMSAAVLSYLVGTPDEQTVRSVTNGVFNIMTFRGAEARSGIESMGVEVLSEKTTTGRSILTVKANPDLLKSIMKVDAVQWVEPKVLAKPMNDLGTKRIRAPSLKALHPTLNGEGVIVGVTDSGIDFLNPGFAVDQTLPTSTGLNTRIIYYEARPGGSEDGLPGDNNGHGTHVSGSILGNGALSATVVKSPGSGVGPYATNRFAGVAPKAQLVMLEDFNSFSHEEQARTAYARGARISNNSWGKSVYEYGAMSAVWDALVRDADSAIDGNQEYIVFFSAGNDGNGEKDGTGGTPNTIGQPGNAKNVITVGAVEQPRFADNMLDVYFGGSGGTTNAYRANSREMTDSDWQIAEYSSRGPVTADDKRVKPDIVVPGSYVLSIQTHEAMFDDMRENITETDYRYGNVDSGTNFAFFNGTSMATPLAAGGAALIYQSFTNTYSKSPSPAMMKAMMVNGAGMLNSLVYKYPQQPGDLSIVDQGWGLLNVLRSVDGMRVHPSDTLICLDQDQTGSLATDDRYSYQVQVGAGEGGLKITLAWTDFSGTPGNKVQLVNDLDLVVFAPGGKYVGNRFSYDGVHSKKVSNPNECDFDRFNNVENIVIPDAVPGTYTVQVRGRHIPHGPQDFALVIMKGIGIEGRSAGNMPDIALDSNDAPVIAYSQDVTDNDTLGRQIMVKRWAGPVGDLSELGTWQRLENQWYEIRNSVSQGIDNTMENSDEPSIAVQGRNIFVAWTEQPRPPETVSRIFLKQFNGSDWIELGGSAQSNGVSGVSNYDATKPVVRVGMNGFPVVAWKRTLSPESGARIFVAAWNGTNWVGFAGSHTNGVPGVAADSSVGTPCMVIDSFGRPVVAWDDVRLPTPAIQVHRWSGSSWVSLGTQGLAPYASDPSLAAGPNGSLYLAWAQIFDVPPTGYLFRQISASRYSGSWSALGNSQVYPGISASSNLVVSSPSIGVSPNGTVFVAWQAGTTNGNSLLCRKLVGSSWVGVGGSENPPGIAVQGGISQYPAIVVDKVNLPTVVFQNAWDPKDVSNTEVVAYSFIGDRDPPAFNGLERAIGGTNSNVQLFWTHAVDNVSSTILYRIYRGTSWWNCGVTPSCNAGDVFSNLIAVVTNTLTYNVTGLTANRSYCFGVRAGDTNGLFEDNTVILSAAAVSGVGDNDNDCLSNVTEIAIGTDACNPDTDGDGMKDGWEWFYSTNNPAHVGPLAMDPLDNGAIDYRNFSAGNTNQLPSADLDGDGASNLEEYQWYAAYTTQCVTVATGLVSPDPTRPDTDGDGMADGWEIINGFNPIDPADAALDSDGDGLSNLLEFQWGSDPWNTDSDSDGLSDGDEVNTYNTDPTLPDTDLDGLDDKYEVDNGSNPRNADGLGHGISDGDMFQLGWPVMTGNDVLHTLLKEDFETSSRTNWTHRKLNAYVGADLWHLSRAEPDPRSTNVVYMYDHTTNTVYAYSTDAEMGTNWAAGYNSKYNQQAAALESPRFSALTVTNLFVAWNEYYATEPNKDFVQVFGRGDGTNWYPVSGALSGVSGVSNALTNAAGRWVHRVLDISRFAGQTNVQVRFVFTANGENNHFAGWYVDDVTIYEGVRIAGWVRDINGAPIAGARVQAIGRGHVTNFAQGNKYVLPGKVFGEAMTAEDGSYAISGLPRGRYYVKASEPSHRSEFWNGALFNAPYGFGRQLNPGVFSVDLATNGWLNLTATGSVGNCHFELEPGKGRAYLGVMFRGSDPSNICYVDGLTTNHQARIWNGVANPGLINFTTYPASTSMSIAINHPDWQLNTVQPTLLGDLGVGRHVIYAGTNLAFYAPPAVDLREGEITLVTIGTNSGRGYLDVVAEDNKAYPVFVDARGVTNTTPMRLSVLAGVHEVRLAPTNGPMIAPKIVNVPLGSRVMVRFSSNDIYGAVGAVNVAARDNNDNVVTGALIYVDGIWYGDGTTNPVVTPARITGLRPGEHSLSVWLPGFKQPELRRISVFSGVTNSQTFTLYDADEDYDLVEDRTEVIGYTNIFKYSRDDDPDADGLANLFEYEQFRLFNIRLNPFHPDTDLDGMSDGAEVNYDGVTNLLAVSSLETNAPQNASVVRAYFVGRFLEGVCNFGSGARAVSIEGDRFMCSAIMNTCAAVPTKERAVTLFLGIPANEVSQSVSVGHNKGALVYADGLPDRVDTDGDGMWDGFEFLGGLNTIAELDVIEAGKTDEDPDGDGLINIREFLGRDWTANTNDWTDPTNADSDDDDMPDGWEMSHGLDPLDPDDAFEDPDDDGLQNISEFLAGTNPKLSDTDGDFLPDGPEVFTYGTDPNRPDTDGDGLLDGREVWDKDMDGIRDGGFFPMWKGGDLDGDGCLDGPTDWDTDGDGMPDGFEVIDEFGNLRNDNRLDPYNPYDGDDDPDGDGLSNLQEYMVRDSLYGNNVSGYAWDYSSDPFNPDSDGDGMPDGWEVMFGLHPMDPVPVGGISPTNFVRYEVLGVDGDLDADGLWNGREYSIRFHLDPNANPNEIHSLSTDPWNPDTDGDGLDDGQEDRSFRSIPVVQDSDADRLMDGVSVSNRYGEVESTLRRSVYRVFNSNITWEAARDAAMVPYSRVFTNTSGPVYSNIIGHLATFRDPLTYMNTLATLGVSPSGVAAIGGFNTGNDWEKGWSWVNNRFFNFFDGCGFPKLSFTGGSLTNTFDTNGVQNNLALTGTNYLLCVTNGQAVTQYIVEWEDVPVATNHFDQALNDLWQLVWPKDDDYPHWQKLSPEKGSLHPTPRWGAAMTYIPVFETKNPKNDNGGQILLDNRKLVVIGGRDGVSTCKDVWEFIIRSNVWVKSVAPLYGEAPRYSDGLGEVTAVPIFVDKNSKDGACPCDNQPYNCDDEGLGLPKNRPWTGSRSFDWTFMYDGMTERHAYNYGYWFYKSSDSKDAVTDSISPDFQAAQYRTLTGVLMDDNVYDVVVGRSSSGDTNYDGFAAFHFSDVSLRDTCEEILHAEIEFYISTPPAADLTLELWGELKKSLGYSPEEYTQDEGTLPQNRLTSDWLNTGPTTFTVLTTHSSGTNIVVDITGILKELVSYHKSDTVNWTAESFGLIAVSTATNNLARFDKTRTRLTVAYRPKYKVDAFWATPNYVQDFYDDYRRKSAGFVYDWDRKIVVMFGGMNGREVLGDTMEFKIDWSAGGDPDFIRYSHIRTPESPSPRWGHSMVYDPVNRQVVMFGGFDAHHRPLNDMWKYEPHRVVTTTETNEGSNVTISVTNDAKWTQITDFRNKERPQPRGGASMVFFGGNDYDRNISEYCVGGDKNGRSIVLFGGTDGNTYFNDTWLYQNKEGGRWVLISPNGQNSESPTPRAFAPMVWGQNSRKIPDIKGDATWQDDKEDVVVTNENLTIEVIERDKCALGSALLFGGRSGVIPTGQDTDMDMVSDGAEYELGGPSAGRDPRVNRLVQPCASNETIPFAYIRIGPCSLTNRGAIADMESLRNDDAKYALRRNLPFENHLQPDAEFHYVAEEYEMGVSAYVPAQINLWYHRFGGEDPFDARDVWEIGVPNNTALGASGAPPYAYSGRWCWGTSLRSTYPNDAIMELYSPLIDLTIPARNSTSTNNMNNYFLVFHEWLDLFDSNDVVRVDAVRPETPADISTRQTSTNKPVLPVLPDRNSMFNTLGKWRRVIVPLNTLANESNVFLRFTLQSDSHGVAGGWYIDDVAVLQAAEITGLFTNMPGVDVMLYGQNYNGHVQDTTTTDGDGLFMFGFLPLGKYMIGSVNSMFGPIHLSNTNSSFNMGEMNLQDVVFTDIAGIPRMITWSATPGTTYRLQYTYDLLAGSWNDLADVVPSGTVGTYTDWSGDPLRYYRIWVLGTP